MVDHNILSVTQNLHKWFRYHEYRGIDPYQIDEKAFGIIKKFPIMANLRSILKPFHSLIPKSAFQTMRPIYHPKAIALIISANARLYQITKDETFLDEIGKLLNILFALRNKEYKNICWGHPFEWGRDPRYPVNSPLVCVQAPIAHCLLDCYEITKNQYSLELFKNSVQYLLEETQIDFFDGYASFHNSPLERQYVHNSNIMAASLLYRSQIYFREERLKQLADQLTHYTLAAQNSDGSWKYADTSATIDNRHTGFVLSSLAQIFQLTGDIDVKESLTDGLNYYKNNLFEDYIPKWAPDQTYPVDIHDVAQSIITFTDAGDMTFARKIIDFSFTQMFNGKDEFYYKLSRSGKVNKTAFIRWGQAWMFIALSKYLEKRD